MILHMEKKFVANKAVLVNAQGKILLVRDTGKLDHKDVEGKWDFPGGRMDVGETPHEGLLRELHEELGLVPEDVQIENPIHVGLWGVGGDTLNQPIVGIFYVVRLIGSPEIRLSEEHNEFKWIDPRFNPPDTEPLPGGETINAFRTYEGIVVASDEAIKGREGYGLIQLFTGNGKGKTTASLGEAIRAIGAGKRVGLCTLIKAVIPIILNASFWMGLREWNMWQRVEIALIRSRIGLIFRLRSSTSRRALEDFERSLGCLQPRTMWSSWMK